MTANVIITGFIVIIIGYLLGAIPSAYVITRIVTGKDIRKIGGGNVGARNVFAEVGKVAGIGVGAFDIVKGVGAVALADWLLGISRSQYFEMGAGLFVLGAGVAVVVGHIWPVYIKFTGGNGLATTIGVLVFLMPREALIAAAFFVVFLAFTHNLILSANLCLLSVPITGWFIEDSWLAVVFPILLAAVMLLHFFPRIVADISQAGSKEEFFAQLFRRNTGEKGKPSHQV
jgi:glycerol-3-phosphate acyltransferase PlsY